ncbi:MAG TPA: glycosyltransferase [Terriglobia bacterium]|nr:glycosyltransferase [Terriglobia bacterium]
MKRRRDSDNPLLLNNLAVLAIKSGRLKKARRYLERAWVLAPGDGDIAYHLGRVYEGLGLWTDALRMYFLGAELLGSAKTYRRLGSLCTQLGELTAAIEAEQETLQLDPQDAGCWRELALNFCLVGELSRSEEAWSHTLSLEPQYHQAHSQRLLTLHYSGNWSPQRIHEEHRKWGTSVEQGIEPFPPAPSSGKCRLRVGYMSPDLDNHAVSFFAEALLRYHNRDVVEAVCFSDFDATTRCARLHDLADEWHDTATLSNEELAKLVRSSNIDVLVDLAGHTSPRDRLLVMAAKPARVQITAVGYPDTTGLTRIDWRLTDSSADPLGVTDRLHSERLLRLDPCFLCYTPPAETVPVRNRSVDGPFTFGSFNALPKISSRVVEIWSRILIQVREARLLLKCPGLADVRTRDALRQKFERCGVAPDQIVVRAPTERIEHLQAYGEVDLALDTFPYNGTTTTCEAMWMGAPVLTLEGNSHVSRVGLSLLTACGLKEFVARSEEHYVQIATEAVLQRPRMLQLRSDMRQRLRRSVLLDGPGYTRRFEDALIKLSQSSSGQAFSSNSF